MKSILFVLLIVLVSLVCGYNTQSIGSSSSSVTAPPTPSPNVGKDCSICEFFVSEISKYLINNSTANEIEYFLDKDCEIFPSVTVECQDYVNQYVPQIINILETEPSSNACEKIYLCPSSSSSSSN